MSKVAKEGIIIYEKHDAPMGGRYGYRNNTVSYHFKCTLCGHRWRRLSQVHMIEHLHKHIANGDTTYDEIFVDETEVK